MVPVEQRRPGRRLIFLAVSALGVSAILTQLVLMRELLAVLAGNEMILGIILGNWFLLTGLGSAVGRTAGRLKRPLDVLVLAQTLTAILPVAGVLAVRVLRNAVFLRGVEIGAGQTAVISFLLLLPYCLIAGYLLTLACTLLAGGPARRSPALQAGSLGEGGRGAEGIGQVYFLDVLGDIIGGLLFTFVLVHFLDHFAILYVPAGLNLIFAVLIAWFSRRRRLAGAILVLALAAAGLAGALDLDDLTTRIAYAGRNVVFHGHSPYGRLVVTESAGQYDFFQDGVPTFATQDVERVEETVHYALAQRPAARRVLLIGGGVSGTAAEVLKYPVEGVDYVELDPLVLQAAHRLAPGNLADRRIHVHRTDGRLFIRRLPAAGGQAGTDRRYDVVILDVPQPVSSQVNRFYTEEFFTQVKRILSSPATDRAAGAAAGPVGQPGVLALSVGEYGNFVGPELAAIIDVTWHTLRRAFANVLILPGQRVFFIASDGALTEDIAARIEQAGIPTQYVTRDFLRATLAGDRLADLRRAVSRRAEVNRDFSPILYYRHLVFWLSRYHLRHGLLILAAASALGVYLARIRAVPLAVFTAGLTASVLEIVILIGFQILHGCLYHQVGLIVTVFMIGLAAGAHLTNRRLPALGRRHLVRLALALAAYSGALPLALLALGRAPAAGIAQAASMMAAMPLLTFILAALVGMVFPLAGKADFQGIAPTAAALYTADYLGACAGALLISTILIPLMGVLAVCILTAGLNILAAIIVRATRAD